MKPQTRGACPGISQPMPTGDGLLARLTPSSPIPLDVFAALCDASEHHGNGVMEVTQRGSLQIRGLSPASAPLFARAVGTLGLGGEDGPPILTSPLMGLDPEEREDLRALAAAVRAVLTGRAAFASIGPKVSVLIDGGGALHLDDVPGDLRLQANGGSRLHVSVGGTAATAVPLGWVEPHRALDVVVQILGSVAEHGREARARNLADGAAAHSLRASLVGLLRDEPPPAPRPRAEPIGIHRLNHGRVALGAAPAFGYAEAGLLKRFAQASARCGATSIRPAPGRALLGIHVAAAAADELSAAAAAAGMVVRSDDARCQVVACAGAPACASATLSTRQLASAVAQAAGPLLDGSLTIHVSGCAKGCAHPRAAALNLIGPGRLVVQGRAGDAPHGTASAADFIAGLPRLLAQRGRSSAGRESSAEMLSRLGPARVLAVMGGEPAHD